jgi:hypothetical protein
MGERSGEAAKAGAPCIVQFYACGQCRRTINPPEDGLCVHGNIYVADPASRGGLIGNNIDVGPDGRITGVRETVLCRTCFNEAVRCDPRPSRTVATEGNA